MPVAINVNKITKCKCSCAEAIYKKAVRRNFRKPRGRKYLQRLATLPEKHSILDVFKLIFRSFLEQICYNSVHVKGCYWKMFLYFNPFKAVSIPLQNFRKPLVF